MHERRKNFRVEWHSPAKIYDSEGRFDQQCIVSNFSNSGARIVPFDLSELADAFILRISPRCRAQQCHVVWRAKDSVGVEFVRSAKDVSELAAPRRRKAVKRGERHPQYV